MVIPDWVGALAVKIEAILMKPFVKCDLSFRLVCGASLGARSPSPGPS